MRTTQNRNRTREWLIIVAVVIALHAVLFISVRPSFFSMFKKTVTATSDGTRGEPFTPTAIFTIPIEIDDQPLDPEKTPVQDAIEPSPKKKKKAKNEPAVSKQEEFTIDEGRPAEAPLDTDNLIGDSPETLPHNIGPEEIMIPPRALEITWPDTRDLEHCLGHHIDMNIHVDEKGRIVEIEPVDANHPADCVRAAVESARRIVFQAGRVDGKPAAMWTQVRIDFRKKQ